MADVSSTAGAVLRRVATAVVGKDEPLKLVLAGILAGGHVLLEDVPGLGKTLAARSFAQALGLSFRRVQFTPDLLPSDVTGAFVFDQRQSDFVFRPGPIFAGLLLADEINRTPPKTQAALLEAMQERQVTVEGETFALHAPFHVLATANPVEYEGTYPLPEAQLDRFLLRVSFGYPTADEEWDVLERRMRRRQEEQDVGVETDANAVLAMQQACEAVTVDETVGRYCVELVAATRRHRHVLVGASPRGSLALLLAARAYAVISGRDFVVPEDVKAVGEAALAHRVTVRPELWLHDISGASLVREVLEQRAGSADGPARSDSSMSTEARWGATPAHLRAVAAGVLLAAIAVVAQRPDLAVMAAPFLAAAAFGGLRRPSSRPRAELHVDAATMIEGQATNLRLMVDDLIDGELRRWGRGSGRDERSLGPVRPAGSGASCAAGRAANGGPARDASGAMGTPRSAMRRGTGHVARRRISDLAHSQLDRRDRATAR